MANAFIPASNTSGDLGYAARAGMLNQIVNALSGVWEVGSPWGAMQPLANPSAPTATLVSSGGNLSAGTYTWALTDNTGVILNQVAYPSGNTTALGAISNTVTASAGDSATLTWSAAPTGTASITLWRTTAGGSTYYAVATLAATTTSYTDTTADSALGTTPAPTVNTTGTPWSVPVYPSYPGFNGTAGALAGQVVSGGTTAPLWWDGVHWQQVPLWTSANTWANAQTFSAVATFTAGITGTGSTGSLTAGSGILGAANTWSASQTVQGNFTTTGYVLAQGSFPNLGDGGGVLAGFYGADATQPILFENNTLLMLGKYNVSGSTQGVLPNNTVWSFLQIADNGQVGTGAWNNTDGTGPVFRNMLDDGSGNASVAGTQTVAGLATFSAGITGAGSVGSLTVPWGNLTSLPSLVNSVTAGSGITVSSTSGSPTITNSGVLSFNGRTGAVVPDSGDYTFADIADTATNAQLAGPLVESLTSNASTLAVTNPTDVGAANVDLNLANANTWTATQTYEAGTTYTASGAAGSYTWQYDSTLNSMQLVYTAS